MPALAREHTVVTEVIIDDSGHYVAEEPPAQFTKILKNFLDGSR